MKRPYLCHIIDNKGRYTQEIINGIVELRLYLRNNGVHFIDSELSCLEDDSVIFHTKDKRTYEIEILVEPEEKVFDGITYISISNYCKKYNKCRQTLYKGISNGKLRDYYYGCSRLVEDTDFKLDRKNKSTRNINNA